MSLRVTVIRSETLICEPSSKVTFILFLWLARGAANADNFNDDKHYNVGDFRTCSNRIGKVTCILLYLYLSALLFLGYYVGNVGRWYFCDIPFHCSVLILQQTRLRWYGHVLQKEDNDWVKKCMEYELECSRPRNRPKRTWREDVQKDCQARNLNMEDAMDRGIWQKLIKTGWSGWWVGECFFWYRLTWADKGP